MASGIVINGQLVLTPGPYTTTVASALGGSNPSTRGIIAVLTDAKAGGEPKVPVLLSQSASLRDWLKADPYLAADLDKACFSPSKDQRVPNGASGVLFVRVNPATRASVTKNTPTYATPAIVYRAADYGALGNAVKVKQETGPVVTVTDGVTTDVINAAAPAGVPMLVLAYDWPTVHAYINWMKAIVLPFGGTDRDAGVYIRWNVTHADDSTWTIDPAVDFLCIDGVLSIEQADQSATKEYVVTGVDKATGLVATETVSFGLHDTKKDTTHAWSSLTSIAIDVLTVGGSATFEADAIAMPAATYNTIGKVIDRVNSYGGAVGFRASSGTGRTSFLVTDMDRLAGVDTSEFATVALEIGGVSPAAGAGFFDTVHAYVAAINAGTTLITAEKADECYGLPANFAYAFLTGGADNTAAPEDWSDALNAIKHVNCSAVWCNSTDPAVHALLKTHVYESNGRGRMERQGYVGIDMSGTLASLTELRAAIAALNYCGIADPCVQQVKDFDLNGDVATYGPQWLALRMAAMEQGRRNEDSILFATMDIQGYVDQKTTWDSYGYTEQLCGAGAAFVQQDPQTLVYRIANESTAHMADDNPVLTSPFAVGSWLRSTQNVRRVLFAVIGRGNWTGSAEDVKNIINRELQRQVDGKEIKAFDAKKTTVIDLGNAYKPAWSIAPAEAIKFIDGTAYIARIPSNA